MRTTATLTLCVAALVLVTGCSRNSGQDTEEAQADQSSTASAAGDAPTAVETQPAPSQGAPAADVPSTTITASPDAGQTTELAAQLSTISPGVADDRDKAVAAAAELCRLLAGGDDETSLSSSAGSLFGADGGPQLTDEQTRAVVAAVQETFCHA